MTPELKAKWIDALRSGKYQQSYGYLRTANGFCCLGVLCDLARPAAWSNSDASHPLADKAGVYINKRKFRDAPPLESQRVLASMNDGHGGYHKHCFAEIADWIEMHIKAASAIDSPAGIETAQQARREPPERDGDSRDAQGDQ